MAHAGAGLAPRLGPVHPLPQGGPRDAAAVNRENLLAAQAVLASGQRTSKRELGQQLGIQADAFKNLFDATGRLIIGTRAVSLVLSPDGPRFAALPRTLSTADARVLDQVLQAPAHAPAGGLRQACLAAGMSPVAVDYLFRSDGTLTGLLDVLTDEQRQRLLARAPGGAASAAQARWQPERQAIGSHDVHDSSGPAAAGERREDERRGQ
jgi:hypothetical protein